MRFCDSIVMNIKIVKFLWLSLLSDYWSEANDSELINYMLQLMLHFKL